MSMSGQSGAPILRWAVVAWMGLFTVLSPARATDSVAQEIDWRPVIPGLSQTSSETQIQIRNAQLTVQPGVSVFAEDLLATLVPLASDGIARLEQLNQVKVKVAHGSLLLDEAVLLEVVQQELARINAPLQIERVRVIANQGLQIEGRILRHGRWVPFDLRGKPTPAGGSVLKLSPQEMRIRGVQAVPLLQAADVHFDEIFQLESGAVRVDRRDLILNSAALLPKPLLDYSVDSLQFLDGSIRVRLKGTSQAGASGGSAQSVTDHAQAPPASWIINCATSECPESFMFLEGGKLAALDMQMAGSPTLLTRQGNRPLSLSLAHIDALVAHSAVRLKQGGALWVQTPLGAPESLPNSMPLPEGADSFKALVEHSGKPGQTLFAVKDSAILTPAGVQVDVRSLIAHSEGASLEELPFVEQQVLGAQLELSDESLEKLLNRVTFFYQDSPVRQVKVLPDPQKIRIQMEVKPSLGPLPWIWTPIEMTGVFKIADSKPGLNFVPDWIEAWGVSLKPLLNGLGLQLDDLLAIDRQDVQLVGDVLRLNLNRALPPLSIQTLVQGVDRLVGDPYWGLRLKVGLLNETGQNRLSATLTGLPAGLWLNAPLLKAFGMTLNNTHAHVKVAGTETLVMDLAGYPQVLTQAVLQMPAPGWVKVEVQPKP